MPTRRDAQLVRQLLAYAAGVGPARSVDSDFDPTEDSFSDADFQWVHDAGFAPLVHKAIEDRLIPPPPLAMRRQLVVTDLVARVRHQANIEAACEVVDECHALGIRPTLLKGILVSQQFYPEPHLRPMVDVDVLVPASSYMAIEAAMVRRGYQKIDYPMRHHGPPLYHPGRQACIELHTDLFPEDAPFRRGHVLSRENAWAHVHAASFAGREVGQLSSEFQLVYLASSWINDLTNSGIRPSFLHLLFDVVFLLRSERASIDWETLVRGIDNPMARASTFVTLDYIHRCGLASVPRQVVASLATGQWIVGTVQVALFRWMVDRYLVAGRRWTLPLPPPVPGRYGLRFQFEKRVMGRLPGDT